MIISAVYTGIIILINIRQQKYLTLKALLSLKYPLHPSRGTNSFMKYRYIIRIAAGIILIMATVFIHNAIAIYQFSQQNQTRVADCAIVAGAGVSGKRLLPFSGQTGSCHLALPTTHCPRVGINRRLRRWRNGFRRGDSPSIRSGKRDSG